MDWFFFTPCRSSLCFFLMIEKKKRERRMVLISFHRMNNHSAYWQMEFSTWLRTSWNVLLWDTRFYFKTYFFFDRLIHGSFGGFPQDSRLGRCGSCLRLSTVWSYCVRLSVEVLYIRLKFGNGPLVPTQSALFCIGIHASRILASYLKGVRKVSVHP